MTLLDILKSLDTNVEDDDHQHGIATNEHRIRDEFIDYERTTLTNNAVFVMIWVKGSSDGGNCWGGETQPWRSQIEPTDIVLLDRFLEIAAPKLTFLQYKRLCSLIQTEDFTKNEYYRNYTDYGCHYIRLKDIKTFLETECAS